MSESALAIALASDRLPRWLDNYSPEPNTGCHLWLGAVSRYGYGKIAIRASQIGAHRVAYAALRGPIPTGLQVCHKCDVRSCINPDHLWLGTNEDNVRDRHSKNRTSVLHMRGKHNLQAILTEDQVRTILADPRTQAAIAADFGVHPSTVGLIKRRERWTHLP